MTVRIQFDWELKTQETKNREIEKKQKKYWKKGWRGKKLIRI